jgi:hypothetical protein
VQVQNLEHSVYQKLKRIWTSDREVMQDRFIPEIGTALDASVAKLTRDIKPTSARWCAPRSKRRCSPVEGLRLGLECVAWR